MDKIIIKLQNALAGIQEDFKTNKGLTGSPDWEEGYANGWKDAVDTIVELLAKSK
jgi:hypothetical protein